MSLVTFKRAERKGSHVIITAYGPSNCGKTYSLIRLGRGLVGPQGRLGLLDTENGRGLIYAKLAGGYDYAELTKPFTPERYIECINDAEEAGLEALIIDSGSHEWEGFGGILEIAGPGEGGLRKWAVPKARHKKYVRRLLDSHMHLLISLRAKEKMIQVPDPDRLGKDMIVSAGYVPIQDKTFVSETTVELFIPPLPGNRGAPPVIKKCPEDLLGAFADGAPINEKTGEAIAEWVAGGVPIDRAFEDLKIRAADSAGSGAEELRKFWRCLSKSERDRLAPETNNLRSIAESADREREDRAKEEEEETHASFRSLGKGDAATTDPSNSAVFADVFSVRGLDGATKEFSAARDAATYLHHLVVAAGSRRLVEVLEEVNRPLLASMPSEMAREMDKIMRAKLDELDRTEKRGALTGQVTPTSKNPAAQAEQQQSAADVSAANPSPEDPVIARGPPALTPANPAGAGPEKIPVPTKNGALDYRGWAWGPFLREARKKTGSVELDTFLDHHKDEINAYKRTVPADMSRFQSAIEEALTNARLAAS